MTLVTTNVNDSGSDGARRGTSPGVRARTASTARAYAEDFARFEQWCARMGTRALPADPMAVMFYLGHLAPTWRPAMPTDPPEAVTAWGEVCESPGLAPNTLVRHLAAIAARHLDEGHTTPTRHPLVADMHRRIRERAADPSTHRRVAPAVPARIRALVAHIEAGGESDRDPVAARDVALILLGYAAALRPHELAALTLDQVREDPGGAWIEVLSRPDDPVAEAKPWESTTYIGAVGDPWCPVAAWQRWRAWLPDLEPDDKPRVDLDGARAAIGSLEAGDVVGMPSFRPIRKGLLGPDGTDDGAS